MSALVLDERVEAPEPGVVVLDLPAAETGADPVAEVCRLAGALNRRIAAVAAVVVVQLAALTWALETWVVGGGSGLGGVLGLQALAFAVALAVLLTSPRPREGRPAGA